MTYNIFDRTAPAMPKPSKGTEIVKLLLSQASKDMREPLIPMSMPALAAHLSDVEFMYYALVPRPRRFGVQKTGKLATCEEYQG